MRRRTGRKGIVSLIFALAAIVAIIALFIILSGTKRDIGECTEYKCDVKNLRLATTIEIDKEGEEFVKVRGNIFTFVVDPLTMYDLEDNKTAYAGDAYHFFAQDSHSIYVNDAMSVEMVGKVNLIGESYDIYNQAEKKVASVSFNFFNTNGEMFDTNGNLIADFNSKLLFNDFDVRIKPECELDEKTVLMIFCSYYSDQEADSKSASSNSSSKESEWILALLACFVNFVWTPCVKHWLEKVGMLKYKIIYNV